MRNLGLGVLVLIAFATPPAGARETAGDAVEQALRSLAAEWRSAYNAKNGAAVAALYAADGWYVSSHVVAQGREAIQAYFQRGIDAGGHIDSIEILSSGHSGELAYWVGTYEATNAGQKFRGRNVVVARRIDRQWRIVAHETAVADQP